MGDSPAHDLLELLKKDVRAKLLDLLDEVAGRKVLRLDGTIIGPLDFIVNSNDLKDHGVQNWYKLTPEAVPTDCMQMIFLVKCMRVELVEWIAAQILADEQQGKERMYVVVFIPRKTEQCVERLNRAKIRANVRIAECALHFFPFDNDIISMDLPGMFNDFHVNGDPSGAFYAAKAVMAMQEKFGVIPSVHAIGAAAKAVADIMLRLRKEETLGEAQRDTSSSCTLPQPGVPPVAPRTRHKASNGAAQAPRISEVILIDRRADPFSVLCSQFTYQALIDTVFGITNNATDVSSADWAKERSPHVRLSPDDPLFLEIRDLHIDKLGLLQEKVKDIEKTYSEWDTVQQKTDEMRGYIKKLKTVTTVRQPLELHINLAHELRKTIQSDDYKGLLRLEDDITVMAPHPCLESIEDLLDDQRPFHEVMRLLCLYSLVNNGVKAKHLDQLKRCILQSYGFEHLPTLCNMERVGLLRYQQGKSQWPTIKRQFNLFVDDEVADEDISYAYSGYAPLSVRLVQMTKNLKGWRSCPEALNLLYGPAIELQQQPDHGAAANVRGAGPSPVTLICFLGGVTYGEVAALRRLGGLRDDTRKFLIMTTEFINARKLIESLRCEDIINAPPPECLKKPQEQPKEARGLFGGLWSGGSR